MLFLRRQERLAEDVIATGFTNRPRRSTALYTLSAAYVFLVENGDILSLIFQLAGSMASSAALKSVTGLKQSRRSMLLRSCVQN